MTTFLDDTTLERLNALAVAPGPAVRGAPSPRRALAGALLELESEQAAGRWTPSLGGRVVVTDRWLIDRPTSEVAAVLETGSIVERAAALVHLVGRSEEQWAVRRADWQRQLSQLMLRFPILLDPRLAFCGHTDTYEWAPLPHILAYTAFGSLPRVSLGIAEPQLRRFASLDCVQEGLRRAAAGRPATGARLAGRTVANIAFGDAIEAASGFPLRGQLLVSLLELSELARQETGSAFFAGARASEQLEGVQDRLGRIFWDVAAAQGSASGITRCEFADAVSQLARTMHWRTPTQILGSSIGMHMDQGLEPRNSASGIFGEYKAAGIRRAIEILVEIGAEPSARAAAQWLSRQCVGVSRLGAGAAAKWHTTEIMAVLEEFENHDVRITLTGADTRGALSDVETFRAWRDAIEMHARKHDMQDAIVGHLAEGPPIAAAAPAPTRRLRRL